MHCSGLASWMAGRNSRYVGNFFSQAFKMAATVILPRMEKLFHGADDREKEARRRHLFVGLSASN